MRFEAKVIVAENKLCSEFIRSLCVLFKSHPRVISSSLTPDSYYEHTYIFFSETVAGWYRYSKTRARIRRACECESYQRVSHAGGCNESLLQSFVLQNAVLLVSLSSPFQIQQILNNLRVSPQSGVDQRRLATLIDVVNLEDVQ